VFDAVAADPAGDHSIPKLAALAAMSPRHLTRLFHEELGTTPAKYVESVRFDGAKAALESGYTITEAAERVGYGSSQNVASRVRGPTRGVAQRVPAAVPVRAAARRRGRGRSVADPVNQAATPRPARTGRTP
jgi:transcriptional regulator GlxA family with amidase domain